MLISIQYPIADLRPFVESEGGRLTRPGWPWVTPGEDFVRAFGGVQKRYRGGLPGWVGEGVHCIAAKSIRFQPGEPHFFNLQDTELGLDAKVPVRVAFRRLYADGLAVVKVELGFSLPERLTPLLSENLVLSCIG